MAIQTAWYRDTPGQTLYAYPLSQAIADWATYAVAFTEKGDGGGWYSADLDDSELDWAIFDAVPTSWDESEYSSIHLEVGGGSSGDGAPYYPTVRRNATDTQPLYFSWETSTTLTAQVSINGGAFQAVAGTISAASARGNTYLYSLSYDANDRTEDGIMEYSITDGTDTYYLPVTVDTGGDSGGGSGGGIWQLTVSADDVLANAVQGARISVDGTSLVVTTDTNGEAVLNLNDGSYTINCSAPSGFNDPVAQSITISGADDTLSFTLTDSGGGTCEIPPL